MGYFSQLAIGFYPIREVSDIATPRRRLIWRIEDLQFQISLYNEEREHVKCKEGGPFIYTDTDLRNMIPEGFERICDLERAIELAKEDLENAPYYSEDEYFEELCNEEPSDDANQITVFDYDRLVERRDVAA